MTQFRHPQTASAAFASVDQGLRSFFIWVYNWMGIGLALTGLTAFLVAGTSLSELFFEIVRLEDGTRGLNATLLGWAAIFAPLLLILFQSLGREMTFLGSMLFYVTFCSLMGISMATVLMIYTAVSVATTFFATAAMFAAMSLYGYVTKSDLSGWGSFLFMGLIGLIIAGVTNIFLGSALLDFIISAMGVLIFVGLTAYDTQKIKTDYLYMVRYESKDYQAVYGLYAALTLYLDAVNLFLYLLKFLGVKRTD